MEGHGFLLEISVKLLTTVRRAEAQIEQKEPSEPLDPFFLKTIFLTSNTQAAIYLRGERDIRT